MQAGILHNMLNITVGGEKPEVSFEGIGPSGPLVQYSKYDIKRFERNNSMFDELVRAVDKLPNQHVPNQKTTIKDMFSALLKATHVFNIDARVTLDIPDGVHAAGMDEKLSKFYAQPLDVNSLGLPFSNTTVVTPDSATVLFSYEQDRPNHVLDSYGFLTLIRMHGRHDMNWVSFGAVGWRKDAESTSHVISNSSMLFVQRGKHWVAADLQRTPDTSLLMSPILGKAIALLMQLNTPDRFILEVSPTTPGIKSDRYIPRSHQRAEYILLHPGVIRQYMHLDTPAGGAARRGHERRAHNRTYPDDPIRFPNAHGKTIRIEALWIGTHEAVVGNRRYKVMLDI